PVPTVTRQWDSADTVEDWERNEDAPSPEPIGPIHHIPDGNGESIPISPAVVGAALDEYARQHPEELGQLVDDSEESAARTVTDRDESPPQDGDRPRN